MDPIYGLVLSYVVKPIHVLDDKSISDKLFGGRKNPDPINYLHNQRNKTNIMCHIAYNPNSSDWVKSNLNILLQIDSYGLVSGLSENHTPQAIRILELIFDKTQYYDQIAKGMVFLLANPHAIELIEKIRRVNFNWFKYLPKKIISSRMGMVGYSGTVRYLRFTNKENWRFYLDILVKNSSDIALDIITEHSQYIKPHHLVCLCSNSNPRAIELLAKSDLIRNIIEQERTCGTVADIIKICTELASNPASNAVILLEKILDKTSKYDHGMYNAIIIGILNNYRTYKNPPDFILELIKSNIKDETMRSKTGIAGYIRYMCESTNNKAIQLLKSYVPGFLTKEYLYIYEPEYYRAYTNPLLFNDLMETFRSDYLYDNLIYQNPRLFVPIVGSRKRSIKRIIPSLFYEKLNKSTN